MTQQLSYVVPRILCPFCDVDVTKKSLHIHVKARHKEEWKKWRDYHLEWNSQHSFIKYIELVYQIKKPESIICYVCNQRVKLKDIRIHILTCEFNSIKCLFCNSSFKNSRNLALHTKRLHPDVYKDYLDSRIERDKKYKTKDWKWNFVKFIQQNYCKGKKSEDN